MTQESLTPSPARRLRWLWIAAGAAVLVAAPTVVLALMPSDEDEALDRCQEHVLDKLKSPSTAEFGEVTVSSDAGNFGTYFEVRGEVDAQNSFGAVIRNQYVCKLTLEQNGLWRVTDSTITK